MQEGKFEMCDLITSNYEIRLVFSPQTHKLCSQEILKVTGNSKELEPNFKDEVIDRDRPCQ